MAIANLKFVLCNLHFAIARPPTPDSYPYGRVLITPSSGLLAVA